MAYLKVGKFTHYAQRAIRCKENNATGVVQKKKVPRKKKKVLIYPKSNVNRYGIYPKHLNDFVPLVRMLQALLPMAVKLK